MLDFEAFYAEKITFAQLTAGLTRDDLCAEVNEMVDEMLVRVAGCIDADVTFQPVDPDAHDPYADDPTAVDLAWTLGHVIVHTTASAEESAALGAELARGVAYHGRSRYEVPWERVTTIAQCRHRLEESRRMQLAALAMWPDEPHMENAHEPWEGAPMVNAVGRVVLGLMHDYDHLDQIAEIVRQARKART
jgi:hypothetical protein